MNKQSFEEKLAEAQKLIGKKLSWKWDIYQGEIVVGKVSVVLKGQPSSKSVEEEAEKNGYCIVLEDKDYYRCVPYNICKVIEEDIIVNGYRADFSRVKSHNIVIFGGNEINYYLFEWLNMLLMNTGTGNSFLRGPFQFGNLTFTEDEVKKIHKKIVEL